MSRIVTWPSGDSKLTGVIDIRFNKLESKDTKYYGIYSLENEVNWNLTDGEIFADIELEPIVDEPHKCTCDRFDVVNFGCKCGGV